MNPMMVGRLQEIVVKPFEESRSKKGKYDKRIDNFDDPDSIQSGK